MQDAGKEDYLRPSERIGLDWIEQAPHPYPHHASSPVNPTIIVQARM